MVKKYYRHIIEADNFLWVTDGTTWYMLNPVSGDNNHSGFVIYLERQEAFTSLSEFITYMDSAYVNEIRYRFNTQDLSIDYRYYKLWCIFTRKNQSTSSSTDKRTNVSNNNISCNFLLDERVIMESHYSQGCVVNPNFNYTKSSFDLKRIAHEKYVTSYTAFERLSNGYIGAYISPACSNFTDNISYDDFDQTSYPFIIKEKIRSRKIVSSKDATNLGNSYKHQAELFANEATGQNILPLKIYEEEFIDSKLGASLGYNLGELELKSRDGTSLGKVTGNPFRHYFQSIYDKDALTTWTGVQIAQSDYYDWSRSWGSVFSEAPQWFKDFTVGFDLQEDQSPVEVVVKLVFPSSYSSNGDQVRYLTFIIEPVYAQKPSIPSDADANGWSLSRYSYASCDEYELKIHYFYFKQWRHGTSGEWVVSVHLSRKDRQELGISHASAKWRKLY